MWLVSVGKNFLIDTTQIHTKLPALLLRKVGVRFLLPVDVSKLPQSEETSRVLLGWPTALT